MRLTRLISALIILLVFGNTLFAQQYRLKKIESYKLTPYSYPDFQKTDSSVFYYSGSRGGYYTADYISQYLLPKKQYFEYFYEPNRIIKHDSICRNNWAENNKTFSKYNIVQQFDNLNNVLYYKNTHYAKNFVWTIDSATYSYNGSRLTQSYSKYPGYQFLYRYNLLKQLDSIINVNGIIHKTFTYGSNYLLQESTEYDNYGTAITKIHYYYNSLNTLDSIVTERFNGTVWYDADTRVYTYTTTPATTTEDYYYTNTASFPKRISRRTINFFSTRNRIDSVYSQWHNGSNFINATRNRYYYNTLILLDSVVTDRWDGTKWADFADTTVTHCHKHYFTYEPYFPTGIATTQNIQINLATYPNPATDIIHLNAELPAQAAVTLGIYDAQGRLLRKQDAAPTKQLRMQMVVADLPSGMYVLRVDGKDISGSQQFIISR